MADIAVTTNGINPAVAAIYPGRNGTEVYPHIADVTLAAGQSVYTTSTGTSGICDANVSGHEQFRGIVLQGVGAGQGVDILRRGLVEGYDLSGLAYDALVYQSDTAGALATTAGTKTVVVGRVVALPVRDSSGNLRKALWVAPTDTSNW